MKKKNNKKVTGYTDTPEFSIYNKNNKVKIIIYDSPISSLRCRIGLYSKNIELSKIFLLLKRNQIDYLLIFMKKLLEIRLIENQYSDESYMCADIFSIVQCIRKYPKESVHDYIETLLFIDNDRNLRLTMKRLKNIKDRFEHELSLFNKPISNKKLK